MTPKTLISYEGPFSYFQTVSLVSNFKASFQSLPENRKLFKILVEICDNISRYSGIEGETGKMEPAGKVVLEEFPDYFLVSAVNPIGEEDWFTLIGKCTKINLLDRDGLKKMRMKYRSQNSKTGNIGLINVSLISRNPILLEKLQSADGQLEASIKVRLNKEEYGKSDN